MFEKIGARSLAGTDGNHVFSNSGAGNRLRAGAGVAGGKHTEIRLIARRIGVGIPNKFIKLHCAQVISALGVFGPTVVPYERSVADGILNENLRGRSAENPCRIKNSLDR